MVNEEKKEKLENTEGNLETQESKEVTKEQLKEEAEKTINKIVETHEGDSESLLEKLKNYLKTDVKELLGLAENAKEDIENLENEADNLKEEAVENIKKESVNEENTEIGNESIEDKFIEEVSVELKGLDIFLDTNKEFSFEKSRIKEIHNEWAPKIKNPEELKNFIVAFLISEKPQSEQLKNHIDSLNEQGKDEKWLNSELREIKRDSENKNIEDNLRMDRFEKIDPEMKKALLIVGKVYAGAKYPWVIGASTALVLESESFKKSSDLDISGSDVDFPLIYSNLLELQKKGEVQKLLLVPQKNFKDNHNGCTKIFAEVKVNDNPESWREIEAFFQNVDPTLSKNGICNVGVNEVGVNIYGMKDPEGGKEVKLPFTDKKESERYYLELSGTELLKYEMAFGLLGAMKKVKNKCLQRLNNILAIKKGNELTKLIKDKMEAGYDYDKAYKEAHEEFNTEEVRQEDIDELVYKIAGYHGNPDIEKLKLSDTEHAKDLDLVEILQKSRAEFNLEKNRNIPREGFVKTKIKEYIEFCKKENIEPDPNYGREKVVDELVENTMKDMDRVSKDYTELENLRLEFNKLVEICKNDVVYCQNNLLPKVEDERMRLSEKIGEIHLNVSSIKETYEGYMKLIDYNDNRDFIPFMGIKQTFRSYFSQSLDLAILLSSKVDGIKMSPLDSLEEIIIEEKKHGK